MVCRSLAGAQPWRYVWPRDSALVASAFARTGHLADAERISTSCNEVQPETWLVPGPLPARWQWSA